MPATPSWLLFTALLVLPSAHAHDAAPLRLLEEITICEPMQLDQRDASLCAIHAEGFHWFIANGDTTWGGIALPGNPVTAHTLAQFALSPSQRYLAINEADEGHPMASIIDFELWQTRGIIKTLWRSAVYPGYIAISHWQGDSLVVTSNHDLTQADRLHLSSENETELVDRNFLIDPQSGNTMLLGN